MSARRILVAGGGIGGSSLAIALALRGIAVEVIEKNAAWHPHSSGIFIYSNGLAALEQLGVLAGVLAVGFPITDGRNVYLAADGTHITDTFYPGHPGSTAPPIVGIRRAGLHRAIVDRMEALAVPVRLGTTVAALVDDGAGVAVTFSDGSQATYDAVIGADGIRSQLRALLFGEIVPVFTGFGAWRSIHRRPPELIDKIMMMGVGKRLGIMPISAEACYIYATANEPGNPWYELAGVPLLMQQKFADFKGPAEPLLAELNPQHPASYTAVEEVHLPLPWSKGRVGIIGDAAHASTPFMGQGGAMAIEDAVVLAQMLAADEPVADTLTAFGKRRYERCNFVQDASRKVGEAGGMENASDVAARDNRLRSNGQADVDRFYARMAEPL